MQVSILYTNTVGLLKMPSLDMIASCLQTFSSSTKFFDLYSQQEYLATYVFVCYETNTPIINSYSSLTQM